jgi:hypothetical protein
MELNAMQSLVFGTVLIPVINEIANFFGDLMTYRNRSFDEDGDPGTGQDCFIQSEATGEFNRVTIKEYKFGLAPSNRKVITLQKSPVKNDEVIEVPYTYKKWATIVKGSLSKPRE